MVLFIRMDSDEIFFFFNVKEFLMAFFWVNILEKARSQDDETWKKRKKI